MRCFHSCLWWFLVLTGIGTIPALTVLLAEFILFEPIEEEED